MGRLLALESFADTKPEAPSATAYSMADVEAARLEGYDSGYRAGWDDAARANSEEQDRIGEEFARNLRDLSFTYHEARAHVITGVEEVLQGFLRVFFPAFVGEALAAHVQEAIAAEIDLAASQPIRLRVSPENAGALRRLLVSVSTLPCVIEEEPTLASGQVYCALGERGFEVDLRGVLDATQAALDALNDINARMIHHG